MDVQPTIRYATTDDGVSLAYHVTGDGPIDIMWAAAGAYPFDLLWDEPGFVHVAKRLAGFSRTIWTGYRGLGASGGRVLDIFNEGVLDADLIRSLDAAGCDKVVLVGPGLGGPQAIRLAARHPDRISALVLIDTFAHYVRHADYPIGFTEEVLDQMVALAAETWATGALLQAIAPSKAGDASFQDRWARVLRLGSPQDQVAESLRLSYASDARSLLDQLTMPTLVLHRTADQSVRVEAGRYLSEHIPGAKYVELAGEDHLFFLGDTDALVDEIEEFLTGTHQGPEGDVVMAAVLFTDIVSSTEQAARLGHRQWSRVTGEHDAMVRSTLSRYRGREIKTIGDGFLATFDATSRAVRAAVDITRAAQQIGLEVRAGVHTGEIEVLPNDVAGLNVNIAKRICDLAGPSQVLVSESVRGLIVDSDIAVTDHGVHVLKGVPRERRVFAVDG
ncbi:MAG TPA: adenylate/guanylate cyclase domain-containing protein [Mycobacteriales bacterium]|nr:adenylate/guanylate cyclase domain-containing protein [Mycobacteriales bacterium]